MTEQPRLTMDAVRGWVGDFEIGKGRPYSRSVNGTVRDQHGIRASVKGTRPRPYRVSVQLADDAVGAARCSCPVGHEGRCKHVAAVLLAFLERPERFVPIDDIDANLAARSHAELISLVKALLVKSPELEPLLARPLPGLSAGKSTSIDYHSLAFEAVQTANVHDDWAPHEIAEELTALVEYARGLNESREPPPEVFAAISRVLREELGHGQATDVAAALPASIRDRLEIGAQAGDQIVPPF